MGGILSSSANAINTAAVWTTLTYQNQRIDWPIVSDSKKYTTQFWFGPMFSKSYYLVLGCAGEEAVAAAIFSDEKILDVICGFMDINSLLSFRLVSRRCHQIATTLLRIYHKEIRLVKNSSVQEFLFLMETRVGEEIPFSKYWINLWSVSTDTILNFGQLLQESVTSLNLNAVGPEGQNWAEDFLRQEIPSKVAILLHRGANLLTLGIVSDFDIGIGGLLKLIIPSTFPQLQTLNFHTYNSDLNFSNYSLLQILIRTSPNLKSVGLQFPDFGAEGLLLKLPDAMQGREFQTLSLHTGIGGTENHNALKRLIETKLQFTELRLRLTGYDPGVNLRIYKWLTVQTECLETLGLVMHRIPLETRWRLPQLRKLEVLSILTIPDSDKAHSKFGIPISHILEPFESEQFPNLNSFVFVNEMGSLDLFQNGIFPGITKFGFSGKNGSLGLSTICHLPNLQHVTLCGVSIEHLGQILTEMTCILELVLILQGTDDLQLDLWDELTGKAPRSWEAAYDTLFPDQKLDFDECEWEKMTRDLEIEDAVNFDFIFKNSCRSFPVGYGQVDLTAGDSIQVRPKGGSAYSYSLTERQCDNCNNTTFVIPSLTNLKRLEFLKISGCNSINFDALVYMSCSRKLRCLDELKIELCPGIYPSSDYRRILNTRHKTLDIRCEGHPIPTPEEMKLTSNGDSMMNSRHILCSN